MTTNLHDKMLAAIDALFSASDGDERDQAEEQLLDVRDELLKQPAQTCSRHAEAERLAEILMHLPAADAQGHAYLSQAAAELRRLVSFNQQLMDEVARLQKAVADEREACAKVCDARAAEYDGFSAEQNASEKLAEAIRARGNT